MRFKKFFPLLFFTTWIFVSACNLNVSMPDLVETPTYPTETIVPTATQTSSPTSTFTLIPTPTMTLFFQSTITPTPQWTTCPGIVITLTDTNKGDMLHLLRCEDGFEYDLGPLAKGVYAVGPNDKFIVYITSSGVIYAARFGDTQMQNIFNLAQEHIFTVFNKKVSPDFKISFVGEEPIYRLVLLERNYSQKRVYELPSWITK